MKSKQRAKSAKDQGEKNNKTEKKMTKKYPPTKSKVTITFLDGEVREYEMSAGNGIGRYLVKDASETGMLTLIDFRNHNSTMVPVANIREFSIDEIGYNDEQEPEDAIAMAKFEELAEVGGSGRK